MLASAIQAAQSLLVFIEALVAVSFSRSPLEDCGKRGHIINVTQYNWKRKDALVCRECKRVLGRGDVLRACEQ